MIILTICIPLYKGTFFCKVGYISMSVPKNAKLLKLLIYSALNFRLKSNMFSFVGEKKKVENFNFCNANICRF